MTGSGPPSDLEAIAGQACQLAGMVARTIRLLRHFATAVFLVDLDEGAVVVRVAYGPDSLGDIPRRERQYQSPDRRHRN